MCRLLTLDLKMCGHNLRHACNLMLTINMLFHGSKLQKYRESTEMLLLKLQKSPKQNQEQHLDGHHVTEMRCLRHISLQLH